MQRRTMYKDELSDEEPFVGRRWDWPQRIKDWRQVFLILAALGGLVALYWWATRPSLPYKITPAGEHVATKFVNELFVRYDCTAAAKLDANAQSDGLPRTNRSCARYVWSSGDLDEGQFSWQLVRGSGSIVHVHGRGNGDDFVSYQLITERGGGLLPGELDVYARRIHGRWMVTSFGATSSGFPSGCPKSGCLALWKRRVNVPLPASAHALTVTTSRTHGGPGTRVVVRVRNCSKPFGQHDPLEWYPGGVSIPIRRTSRSTVSGVFVVRSYDDPGPSYFQFLCGPSAFATANFTVTR